MENKEPVIVLMLDVQGVIDNVDNENIKIIISQIQRLRLKFNANKAIINLSSHLHSPDGLIKFLEILERNLEPSMMLGEATYLSGTFNFYNKHVNEVGFGYNLNKTATFEEIYLGKYNVNWFAIIDDSINHSYIKKFQDNRPMIVCRPSLKKQEDLKYDNFMCYSSLSYGILGVAECLELYLERIENMTIHDIFEEQKNILPHLSAFDIDVIIFKREFSLLYRYINDNKIDEEDYEEVVLQINGILKSGKYSKEELIIIQKIMEIVIIHLTENHEQIKVYKCFFN